jgi:hypothetical protein
MTVISFRLRICRHGGCTSIKDTLISVLEMKPSSRISVSYSVQYLIRSSILFGCKSNSERFPSEAAQAAPDRIIV